MNSDLNNMNHTRLSTAEGDVKQEKEEEKQGNHEVSELLLEERRDDNEVAMLDGASGLQDLLETMAERRGRRRSHLVAYITTFVMSIGFSIVLTGVWPYLRQLQPGVSKGVLGWVIAANPIGQMIASPLLGYWGNRAGSNRGAFLMTVGLFCLGNGLYAVLHAFGSAALAIMIFSRFLVGVSSANIALIRAYISSSTTLKERTMAVGFTSAAQATGFIIGPAIQTALATAFNQDMSGASNSTNLAEETQDNYYGVQLNMYTATGWIGVFLGFINFILFLPCIFTEYSVAAKEAHLQRQAANTVTTTLPKPDYLALLTILSFFFVITIVYVLLETLMVPMCMDLYAWTDERAITVVGIGLCISAALTLLIFIGTGYLVKLIDERLVLIVFGALPMTVAMLIFFPYGGTYPKIKNCTDLSFNQVLNTTVYQHHLMLPPEMDVNNEDRDLVSKHPVLNEKEFVSSMHLPTGSNISKILEGSSVESHDYPLRKLNSTFLLSGGTTNVSANESEVLTPMPLQLNTSDSKNKTHRRKRRHIIQKNDCDDPGCPPEQEWCLYTPITGLVQMSVACLFAVMGYAVGFTMSSALFSKILGPKAQGVWMGILTSTGSLSRVIGPIAVSYVYTELGTRWTFGLLFILLTLVSLVDIVMYKKMVPMNVLRER